MSPDQLRSSIMEDFAVLSGFESLDKESAMALVRERLKDYPKHLQEFGDWFDKNYATVLDRINHG